jgi:hypothetical protein
MKIGIENHGTKSEVIDRKQSISANKLSQFKNTSNRSISNKNS